ncbi:hypothetical protein HHL28_04240 [Aerophototrophica crusticola]|uniref:YARHG domain-containing protein n=1 Tax=Aerophototrophica crusticola TaxID=1709002 RepID=A0A858R4M0_9PROT|nr:hypothetical protein HHL28_04240 [Rhodospirillaceae bacterium B3]
MAVRFVALVLAGMVFAGPGLAQETAPPTPAQQPSGQPAAAGDDEEVCKTLKITGSRLGKNKVCKTKKEWAAMEAENQKALKDIQARGGVSRSAE